MIESYGIMNDETMELLIKKALDYADNTCTFAFQGGEPTLAGLEYYKKFVEVVKKYKTKRININYSIQTNGVAIDEDWAMFLADNNFLTGISLDGYKDVHDSSRIDAGGMGSFNKAMSAINLFNRFQVEYNILCVVNSYTARHVNKVNNFFKKNNFKYLQFIPCLDPLNEVPGMNDFSLTPERYEHFLKNLFDEWYNDIIKGNITSIRYFDNLVGILMGYPPESCGMSGVCSAYFVVEADGGVYPCDFYVLDEWRLGNIRNDYFYDFLNSEKAKEFVEVSKYIDPSCRECSFYNLCRGGCRRSREPFIDSRPALNYYCSSYKAFFEYASNRLQEIAFLFSRK